MSGVDKVVQLNNKVFQYKVQSESAVNECGQESISVKVLK